MILYLVSIFLIFYRKIIYFFIFYGLISLEFVKLQIYLTLVLYNNYSAIIRYCSLCEAISRPRYQRRRRQRAIYSLVRSPSAAWHRRKQPWISELACWFVRRSKAAVVPTVTCWILCRAYSSVVPAGWLAGCLRSARRWVNLPAL